MNLDVVPRNSSPGGFTYIGQSESVGIIKERKNPNSLFKRRSRCRGVVGS